jgi:hypothetical protein
MYARRAWIVLVAALALIPILAACGGGGGEEEEGPPPTPGSGNIVTQTPDLADFTAVEVSNAFTVDIAQSDTFSVTIRVDDNVVDSLDVSKAGDTLRIRLTKPQRFADVTLEASITMPELSGLNLSGATRVTVTGFESVDPLDIVLSGASNLDGVLEAGSVDIDASGASKVSLEGSAGDLSVRASGASSLDLTSFEVDTAGVTLSGASNATINANDRIDPVDVSGASHLRYLSGADLGKVTTSGASTVEQID